MRSLFIMFILMVTLIACNEKPKVAEENEIEEVSSISAKTNLELAEEMMFPIDSSAKLYSITTSFLDSVGKSFSWNYHFMSTEKSMRYLVELDAFSAFVDSTNELLTGLSILSASWIDSDVAFVEAQNNSGAEFRNKYSDCKVSASLSEPLIPDSFPIWRFKYVADTEELFININAVNRGINGD